MLANSNNDDDHQKSISLTDSSCEKVLEDKASINRHKSHDADAGTVDDKKGSTTDADAEKKMCEHEKQEDEEEQQTVDKWSIADSWLDSASESEVATTEEEGSADPRRPTIGILGKGGKMEYINNKYYSPPDKDYFSS